MRKSWNIKFHAYLQFYKSRDLNNIIFISLKSFRLQREIVECTKFNNDPFFFKSKVFVLEKDVIFTKIFV